MAAHSGNRLMSDVDVLCILYLMYFVFVIVIYMFLCHRNLKFNIKLDVNFKRPSTDDVQRTASASFCSPAQAVYSEHDIEEAVDNAVESIQSRSDTFESYGSGWVVSDIERFSVDTAILDVIGGSSYVPLPPHLAKKGQF